MTKLVIRIYRVVHQGAEEYRNNWPYWREDRVANFVVLLRPGAITSGVALVAVIVLAILT